MATSFIYASLAQSAEHLPFKQGVRGSNPRRGTKTPAHRAGVFVCRGGDSKFCRNSPAGCCSRQRERWRQLLFSPVRAKMQTNPSFCAKQKTTRKGGLFAWRKWLARKKSRFNPRHPKNTSARAMDFWLVECVRGRQPVAIPPSAPKSTSFDRDLSILFFHYSLFTFHYSLKSILAEVIGNSE